MTAFKTSLAAELKLAFFSGFEIGMFTHLAATQLETACCLRRASVQKRRPHGKYARLGKRDNLNIVQKSRFGGRTRAG
jgi:hypothetical protein